MFKEFNSSLDRVSSSWSTAELGVAPVAAPGLHRPHSSVSEAVLKSITGQETTPRIQKMITHPGIQHGLDVILRYYYHAVSSAAEQSVGLDEAEAFLGLENGQGIRALTDIAALPDDTAKAPEGYLCIQNDTTSTLQASQSVVYRWQNGRLVHPPSLAVSTLQRQHELEDYRIDDVEAMCHAHRANQLTRTARILLEICSSDPAINKAAYAATRRSI